ncbi:MAG: heparinase II/III family protein [Acidobacteria bacterium]|nr:heparinase II/III family protein [Acidobacteriota bacterium]
MNETRIGMTLLVLALLLSPAGAPADELAYPPTISLEEVRQWIDRAPKEHPRLLVTPGELAALRSTLDRDPTRQRLADAVVAQAELMLELPPVTRTMEGRRLLGVSRRVVKRVVALAMAYHLEGDARFARRAEKEMLAAAAFEDWNPSHFLDVAEMALALAVGYDWLYDRLDPGSRETIRTAIVDKGVALQFDGEHTGWVQATNNWGQVCHGGLTAGALAVMEDEPDLAARTVHSALDNVTASMAVYAPRGSYPEGPGYWSYGTTYNVVLIAALESALGTDFGLSRAPGFEVTGQFPALATGPSGLFFNYADGSDRRGVQPALFWFGERYARPDWLLGERDRIRTTLAKLTAEDAASGSGRFLPLSLLWMSDEGSAPPIGMPLHWSSGGETPITVHRSSWTEPGATYVGLKGGSPSANHGQMDTGSFVLDADGVRWALDLGAEPYHGIESRGMNLWDRTQDSDRWTIFRQQNEGHNTLVIDGQLQKVSGHGLIVAFSDAPSFPHSIVDMSSVYAGQAQSVRRGVALLPSGAVLVQDEIAGLTPGRLVRWGMITRARTSDASGAALTLNEGEKRLRMERLSPSDTRWEVIGTGGPRHEWDSPNPGTRMIAFEAVAPESGELRLAVLMTPGSAPAGPAVELRPLADWGAAPPTVIRLGPGAPVNPGVFGANDTHADADLLETKESFRGLLRALGARRVRFIGGSPSSFWDWRTGHYIPEEEITRIWPAEPNNWMIELVDDTKALPDGTLGPLSFHEFAEAIGADVQWLTNMTTRADDMPAFFEYLKENDVPVRFVEMDNETYFWGGEFGGVERGETYATRVDALSPVIRRLFPDARIGIVAAEDDLFTNDPGEGNPPMAAWNGHITQPGHRPHYDAFILHHYVMQKGRLDAFGDDARRAEAFLALPQVTLERAARLIASRYGPIPMWITEYNVIGYYGPKAGGSESDQWIQATRDTPWNALYQAAFWLTGLARPDAIEILNHHSVTNIDLGWGLGEPINAREANLTITGQLFAHLSWLASRHDTMHPLEIAGNPPLGLEIEGETGIGALHGAALAGEARTTLLVMNRGEATVPVTLETGARASRLELTRYDATASCEPLARVRLDSDTPPWQQGPCTPHTETRTLADGAVNATLAPYSLTILVLETS